LARIVSIGEILWDVFPDSDRLGGATFNFSVNARRLGHEVTFVSAVGDDERGRAARLRTETLGLDADFIQVVPGAPTGWVSVGLDSPGHPDFIIHRPAAYDRVVLGEPELARLAAWNPDWIYYGTLHQIEPASRAVTRKLMEALPAARTFYDVNLRRDSYSPELVLQLLSEADAVKLNDDEVAAVESMAGSAGAGLQQFTADWSWRMGWRAVAVTRGKDGCAVRIGEEYAEVRGHPIAVVDTVGAGDAFAAAFWCGLAQNWSAARIADFANRLGAVVASRAGGLPEWSTADFWTLP
jgi:fructokinase